MFKIKKKNVKYKIESLNNHEGKKKKRKENPFFKTLREECVKKQEMLNVKNDMIKRLV